MGGVHTDLTCSISNIRTLSSANQCNELLETTKAFGVNCYTTALTTFPQLSHAVWWAKCKQSARSHPPPSSLHGGGDGLERRVARWRL